MTKLALLLTGVLAGAVVTVAAPAGAAPTPQPRMVDVRDFVAGVGLVSYRCAVIGTTAIDCDWDHGTPVPWRKVAKPKRLA